MKLKELRIKNNLTQKDLSNYLQITNQTYSNYEIGKTEPDIETLKKISDFFNISVDELIEHKKYENEITNIVLTDNQKIAIQQILKLNDFNLLLAISYCKGLYANQTN